MSASGQMIRLRWYGGHGSVPTWRVPRELYAEWLKGFKQRTRKLDVKIPASALRRGVNVLAIEIHRAPAMEAMFGKLTTSGSLGRGHWWNRAALEAAVLTAPAGSTGVVANVSRPKRLQVWDQPVFQRLNVQDYAGPEVGSLDTARPKARSKRSRPAPWP